MYAQKKNFPRYRTIKECLETIKALDSDTAISEWFIRQLCKNQKISYFASGNKSLVNLDSLLAFLGYAPTLLLNESTQKLNLKENQYE